jgi:hypothetical protein
VERLGVYLGGVGRDLAVLTRQFGLQIFSEKPQRIQIGRERFASPGTWRNSIGTGLCGTAFSGAKASR